MYDDAEPVVKKAISLHADLYQEVLAAMKAERERNFSAFVRRALIAKITADNNAHTPTRRIHGKHVS